MSFPKIYTQAEHKYLLLPQDQKLIKELVGTNRLNNTVIEILDKRQAEFDKVTKHCSTLEGKIYLWQMRNGLLPKEVEVEVEEPGEETELSTSDHFSINEKSNADDYRDMWVEGWRV